MTYQKEAGMPTIRQLYRSGIGPSSSHTIGPERICRTFLEAYPNATRFEVVLFGSLAQTGVGHGTDTVIRKVLAPKSVEIVFNMEEINLPHPNTMDISAYDGDTLLAKSRGMSVGGGEIRLEGFSFPEQTVAYPHRTFQDIAAYCKAKNMRLWEYVEEVEGVEIREFLLDIWETMCEAVRAGLWTEGVLPGGLGVSRKARHLYNQNPDNETHQTRETRHVCAYAFAVSEENAAGGRIVTAPTCGAAGVLPAVLYHQMQNGVSDEVICHALATASVVGNLTKTNASVSGAECGCQAEIGTACSMAAAALAEIKGMSIDQIEYAAEIAFEHQLGLTCDPICGLVQIPCIERNAVAAMRALNAVCLAEFLTDSRKISLDLVIRTMYETGKDLHGKYRETATGGLAELYGKTLS